MEPASRSTRLVAQFIDGLIAIVPFILAVVLFLPDSANTAGESAALLAFVFCVGYYLFADALPGGRSLGKRLFGIAVVDQHRHTPCSGFQSFIRNVAQPILGPLDWLFIFGSGRQRLGDMVAGTIVVEQDAAREPRGKRRFDPWPLLAASILVTAAILTTTPDSGTSANNLRPPAARDAAGVIRNPRIVLSSDGGSQITVPGRWRTLPEASLTAEIRVGSIVAEQFVIVQTNSRDSIPGDVSLERFAEWAVEDVQEDVAEATPATPRHLTVGGRPAIQYEVRDTVDVLWMTVVESETHFHRVLAWTPVSRAEASEPLMQAVIQSFRETRQQAPTEQPGRAAGGAPDGREATAGTRAATRVGAGA
ncbi:MAG TPA: RDD family protein [Longimicrobium sp.]|nr:RDD family protein [Longimicrobium sp.]